MTRHNQAFKPAPYNQRNVPKPGYSGRRDKWITPVLRYAKILIWDFALQKGVSEDAVMEGKWQTLKITKSNLADHVRRYVPGFEDDARRVLGIEPSQHGEKLYGRLYEMYHEQESLDRAWTEFRRGNRVMNEAGTAPVRKRYRAISVEHPTRSDRLRPFRIAALNLHNTTPGMPTLEQVSKVFQ